MNNYKIIIGLVLFIAVACAFAWLWNEKTSLEKTILELNTQIVEYKGKIVDQETEINILTADNDTKQVAIGSLEEKLKLSSNNCQEAINQLLELTDFNILSLDGSTAPEIVVRINPSAEKEYCETAKKETAKEPTLPPTQAVDQLNPAAEQKEAKSVVKNEPTPQPVVEVKVVNEQTSKKFIDMRNNIYSRYQ